MSLQSELCIGFMCFIKIASIFNDGIHYIVAEICDVISKMLKRKLVHKPESSDNSLDELLAELEDFQEFVFEDCERIANLITQNRFIEDKASSKNKFDRKFICKVSSELEKFKICLFQHFLEIEQAISVYRITPTLKGTSGGKAAYQSEDKESALCSEIEDTHGEETISSPRKENQSQFSVFKYAPIKRDANEVKKPSLDCMKSKTRLSSLHVF